MSDQYDDDIDIDLDLDDVADEAHAEEVIEEVVAEKKQSRADKRIGELTWRAKTAEERYQASEAARQELERRLVDAESKIIDHSKEKSGVELDRLKAEKADALEIGDYNRANEIDDEIFEVRLTQKIQPRPQQRGQAQQAMSTAQAQWESENENIKSDPVKLKIVNESLIRLHNVGIKADSELMWNIVNKGVGNQSAIKIAEQLISKHGYAPDDDRLIPLIEKNLKKRETQPSPDGNGFGGTGSTSGITEFDRREMKKYGLNPDDPATRIRYKEAVQRAKNDN